MEREYRELLHDHFQKWGRVNSELDLKYHPWDCRCYALEYMLDGGECAYWRA